MKIFSGRLVSSVKSNTSYYLRHMRIGECWERVLAGAVSQSLPSLCRLIRLILT